MNDLDEDLKCIKCQNVFESIPITLVPCGWVVCSHHLNMEQMKCFICPNEHELIKKKCVSTKIIEIKYLKYRLETLNKVNEENNQNDERLTDLKLQIKRQKERALNMIDNHYDNLLLTVKQNSAENQSKDKLYELTPLAVNLNLFGQLVKPNGTQIKIDSKKSSINMDLNQGSITNLNLQVPNQEPGDPLSPSYSMISIDSSTESNDNFDLNSNEQANVIDLNESNDDLDLELFEDKIFESLVEEQVNESVEELLDKTSHLNKRKLINETEDGEILSDNSDVYSPSLIELSKKKKRKSSSSDTSKEEEEEEKETVSERCRKTKISYKKILKLIKNYSFFFKLLKKNFKVL